jgi:hypothetical protein
MKKTNRVVHIKPLKGKQFGRLMVVEMDISKTSGPAYWICRCECQNRISVLGSNLTTGVTRSCGCLRREHAIKTAKGHEGTPLVCNRKKPYEWLHNIVRKYAAKKYPSDPVISYEEFLALTTTQVCFYCGAEIDWPPPYSTRGKRENYNLDRKDNSRGYPGWNVVVCCSECNRGKSARYTFGEWIVMAAALRRYRTTTPKQKDLQ